MATVILRNTISGVPHAYDEEYARDLLNDPRWSQIFVEVDSTKPEVLAGPHTIEDGKRKPVKVEDSSPNDKLPSPEGA